MEIEIFISSVARATESGTILWMSIANIIIGIIFAALACWLIWIYFDNRDVWSKERPEYDKYSSGTFKGYWYRYRAFIVNFLAALFIILSIAFVAMGALGIEPKDDIVGTLAYYI